MSGSGKDVSGVVGISQDEVGAGTFPDTTPSNGMSMTKTHQQSLLVDPQSYQPVLGFCDLLDCCNLLDPCNHQIPSQLAMKHHVK